MHCPDRSICSLLRCLNAGLCRLFCSLDWFSRCLDGTLSGILYNLLRYFPGLNGSFIPLNSLDFFYSKFFSLLLCLFPAWRRYWSDLFFRLVNCFFACQRNRSFLFLPFNNLSCLSTYLMPCFVKDAVSILAGRIFCITYRIILSITGFLRRLHDSFFCSDIGMFDMVCHRNRLI